MKKVGIVYDNIYSMHETQSGFYSHPECKERVLVTVDKLKEHNFYGPDSDEHFIEIEPVDASYDQIKWVHDQSLINEVEKAVASSSNHYLSHMDGDTPVSPHTLSAALKAAGGNFSAIDAIMAGKVDRAFVLCRPPGHHANKGYSRGFCIFNNIALAVHYLLREKGIKKVAILDFDVHAGNGTEDIFWTGTGIEGTDLLFISSHQDPHYFYPGECFVDDIGSGSQKGKIANITFTRGCGDKSMQLALDKIVIPMMHEFKPEIILFSAGFDAHSSDPIGGLKFTEKGYYNIIKKIEPIADEYCKGRMIATLEGGYNLQALARSITDVLAAMSGFSIVEEGEEYEEDARAIEFTENKLIPSLEEILSPYWSCFK
ncbi:MAG: histone deacetylase family protein [Promethearchaeota archaeon]